MGSPTILSNQYIRTAVLAALYGARAFGDTAAESGTSDENMLQEVTVTATKRAVSAQDLPISITAVSGASLEAAGVEDIAGLARSMAGVNFTDKGPFSAVAGADLIIRGLNSETTSGNPASASPVPPPVATYVDDTPLFVNLRLQDLDHVEVLRGPQGTLYGSGSLGGTIRFVENAPDPSGFDAKLEAGASDTQHTHAANEDLNGMVNLPITDTFAIRLNGGLTNDAGFINNPNLFVLNAAGEPVSAQPGNPFSNPEIYEKKGVNSYQYRSGRFAALWKPSDVFKAEFSYYYQLGVANGYPYIAANVLGYNSPINPANLATGFTNPASVTQLYNLPLPSGIDRLSSPENIPDTTRDLVNMAALTLEHDMGFATLTSASSWARHNNTTVGDETSEYENFPEFSQDIYGQNPRTLVVGHEGFLDKPRSEEVRLASKSGGFFEWVGGLFYKYQTQAATEDDFYPGYSDFYAGCAPLYGQSPGDFVTPSRCGVGDSAYVPGQTTTVNGIVVNKDELYAGLFNNTFKEYAGFGELTAHVTKKWSVTGGARVFKQTLTQTNQAALLLVSAPQYNTPPTNLTAGGDWKKALGKLNTAYQWDPNNLVYATWSQGFRHGSINALPAVAAGVVTPAALLKVAPDTANNYEVGAKGTLWNRFRYSAAIYDVEWHNIQEEVSVTPIVVPGTLNIGNGHSRGLELELEYALTEHLSTHASYTFDATALTSISPLYVAPYVDGTPPVKGSPLPGTPKNSLALGIDYGHFRLAGGELGYAINAHYQSEELSALSSSIPEVPGYTTVDTRLSFAWPHWVVTAYANNVTNNLGILAYQDPASYGNRYMAVVSQPRTIGLRASYSFKEH
jgi:outer membrane receptor protein involved in Fe transport